MFSGICLKTKLIEFIRQTTRLNRKSHNLDDLFTEKPVGSEWIFTKFHTHELAPIRK